MGWNVVGDLNSDLAGSHERGINPVKRPLSRRIIDWIDIWSPSKDSAKSAAYTMAGS